MSVKEASSCFVTQFNRKSEERGREEEKEKKKISDKRQGATGQSHESEEKIVPRLQSFSRPHRGGYKAFEDLLHSSSYSRTRSLV